MQPTRDLPLIISTGMAGLGDIERALEAVTAGGGNKVALLHCGSSYPLNAASANLAAMDTIRRAFGAPVGYSDHTMGLAVPTAAAALGAAVLEKHFSLDRKKGTGPDHSFAVEPAELKSMVELMRGAEQAIGSPRKSRATEEEPLVRLGRRSIFVTRKLNAGDKLTPDNIKVLRPGIGIDPAIPAAAAGPARHPRDAGGYAAVLGRCPGSAEVSIRSTPHSIRNRFAHVAHRHHSRARRLQAHPA